MTRTSKLIAALPRAVAATIAAAVLLLAGCSSTNGDRQTTEAVVAQNAANGKNANAAMGSEGTNDNFIDKAGTPSIDDMIAAAEPKVEQEEPLDTADSVGEEITSSTTRAMPLEINALVEGWIQYFTARDRERFQRFMERGEKYRPMITAVLKDQGIPSELYFQAMIESGFSVAARSSAQAVGIWQFIRGTGKRYGLRTDSYVDERRDPMRATIAASLYMRDLYNVFQSWYLALGAYNAGEGRILGAIMRGKTRDFWELVRKKQLPAETMNYIPKFLAATIIGHNPKKYGFDELNAEVMPTLASVSVASPVKLSDIARLSGISLDTLHSYNPHILRGMTPPGVSQYRIWVPKDMAREVESQKEAIAALRIKSMQRYAVRSDEDAPTSSVRKGKNTAAKATVHKVKRGETLARIAQRYGLTLAQIRSLNKMRSNTVFAGSFLTVGYEKSATRRVATPQAATKHYRVRAGDSLEAIARRFNISLDELKEMNRLKRNRIYAGQVLRVREQQG